MPQLSFVLQNRDERAQAAIIILTSFFELLKAASRQVWNYFQESVHSATRQPIIICTPDWTNERRKKSDKWNAVLKPTRLIMLLQLFNTIILWLAAWKSRYFRMAWLSKLLKNLLNFVTMKRILLLLNFGLGQLTSFMSIHSYCKPTFLNVHPPITAHATMPGRLEHSIISFCSALWIQINGERKNLRGMGFEPDTFQSWALCFNK